jgi:hypothetical protein
MSQHLIALAAAHLTFFDLEAFVTHPNALN